MRAPTALDWRLTGPDGPDRSTEIEQPAAISVVDPVPAATGPPTDTLTSDNRIGSFVVEWHNITEAAVIDRTDLLQGTLDLLILRTLRLGPLHGWAISKRIRQLSSDALQVNQGSLYPALYRLEDKGWIAAEAGLSDDGRRIKLYRLTDEGRRQSAAERKAWRGFVTAVDRLIEET